MSKTMENYKSTFVPRLVRRFCQELSYGVLAIERGPVVHIDHEPHPAYDSACKFLGVVIPSGACPKASLPFSL